MGGVLVQFRSDGWSWRYHWNLSEMTDQRPKRQCTCTDNIITDMNVFNKMFIKTSSLGWHNKSSYYNTCHLLVVDKWVAMCNTPTLFLNSVQPVRLFHSFFNTELEIFGRHQESNLGPLAGCISRGSTYRLTCHHQHQLTINLWNNQNICLFV